ncbi:MAG: tol-pal system YbgF family protein, partial [Myxococcota bacterium]
MPRLCADCSSLVPSVRCPHCGSRQSGSPSSKPGPTRLVATLMVLGLSLAMDGPEAPVVALYGVIATEPARPIPVRPAQDLLEDAAQRIKEGDLDGAEILLSEAERQSGEVAVEVAYQRANIKALRREYTQARAAYQAIIDRFPGSIRERDAQYRVAELTG